MTNQLTNLNCKIDPFACKIPIEGIELCDPYACTPDNMISQLDDELNKLQNLIDEVNAPGVDCNKLDSGALKGQLKKYDIFNPDIGDLSQVHANQILNKASGCSDSPNVQSRATQFSDRLSDLNNALSSKTCPANKCTPKIKITGARTLSGLLTGLAVGLPVLFELGDCYICYQNINADELDLNTFLGEMETVCGYRNNLHAQICGLFDDDNGFAYKVSTGEGFNECMTTDPGVSEADALASSKYIYDFSCADVYDPDCLRVFAEYGGGTFTDFSNLEHDIGIGIEATCQIMKDKYTDMLTPDLIIPPLDINFLN